MGACVTLHESGLRRPASRLLTSQCVSLATSCRDTRRQRSVPSLGRCMPSPLQKSRCSLRSPRKSPRAQLQSELPSIHKNKQLHHTHTEMHLNGTAKQANDRRSTPRIFQAVRGYSNLPARPWGDASTLPPAPHSPRHRRLSAVTTRPDQCDISRHHPQSRKCPSRSPGSRCCTCKIDLRQNHQNHDRCEADVEVSATH